MAVTVNCQEVCAERGCLFSAERISGRSATAARNVCEVCGYCAGFAANAADLSVSAEVFCQRCDHGIGERIKI